MATFGGGSGSGGPGHWRNGGGGGSNYGPSGNQTKVKIKSFGAKKHINYCL